MIFRSEIETYGNEKRQLISVFRRGRYKYHFGWGKYVQFSVEKKRRQFEFKTRQFDNNRECDWFFIRFCLNLRIWIGLFMLCSSECEGAHLLKC